MGNKLSTPMTPFDELVSSPELQIIKALIPYLSESAQKTIGACCKFLELQRTIRLFTSQKSSLHAQMLPEDNGSLTSPGILEVIRPYLDPEKQGIIDMIINMKSMLEMAEMMKGTMDGSSLNPMDLAASMLSPEQQEMLREYSDIFTGEHGNAGTSGEQTQDDPQQNNSLKAHVPDAQPAADAPDASIGPDSQKEQFEQAEPNETWNSTFSITDDYNNMKKGDEQNERMDEQSCHGEH